MKIRVTKNKTVRRSGNWEKVEYSLETDTTPENLYAIKRQLEAVIDKWLGEK